MKTVEGVRTKEKSTSTALEGQTNAGEGSGFVSSAKKTEEEARKQSGNVATSFVAGKQRVLAVLVVVSAGAFNWV